MSIIDLKLKTYDELTFEITQLNTDKYLLEQKLQQKENIIKEAIEYVKTKNYCSDIFTKDFAIFDKQELLEILDKGE